MIINKKEYKEIKKEINKLSKNVNSLYMKIGFEDELYVSGELDGNNIMIIHIPFHIEKEIQKNNNLISSLDEKITEYDNFKRIERSKTIVSHVELFDDNTYMNIVNYIRSKECCEVFEGPVLDLYEIDLIHSSGKDEIILNDLYGKEIKIYIKKENQKIRKEFLNKNNDIYIDINFSELNYNDFIYIIDNNIDFVISDDIDNDLYSLRVIFNKEYYKLLNY